MQRRTSIGRGAVRRAPEARKLANAIAAIRTEYRATLPSQEKMKNLEPRLAGLVLTLVIGGCGASLADDNPYFVLGIGPDDVPTAIYASWIAPNLPNALTRARFINGDWQVDAAPIWTTTDALGDAQLVAEYGTLDAAGNPLLFGYDFIGSTIHLLSVVNGVVQLSALTSLPTNVMLDSLVVDAGGGLHFPISMSTSTSLFGGYLGPC